MSRTCCYCGEPIKDNARKCPHCLSDLENRQKEPEEKAKFDAFDFCLKFITANLAFLTLGGAVFAFFGYNSIDSLSKELRTVNKESSTYLSSATTTLTQVKQEEGRLAQFLSDAQKKYSDLSSNVERLWIRMEYANYISAMDDLVMDDLRSNPTPFSDLQNISKEISLILEKDKIGTVQIDGPERVMALEILLVVKAIKQYDDGEFKQAIETVKEVSDEVISKHRIMSNSNSRLYDLAMTPPTPDVAAARSYAAAQVEHDAHAIRLLKSRNKTLYVYNINYATSLFHVGTREQLDEGRRILESTLHEAPGQYFKSIYLNLAVYYMMINDLDNALGQLELCKQNGGLNTAERIKKLKTDPDFALLFQSKVPEHAKRLAEITKL